MPDASASVVIVPIAALSVVVDAACVDDVQDAASATGRRRDLATWVGARWDGGTERRALRLASDGSWLVVGDRVIVRRLGLEAFRPVPLWLRSLEERLAIVSLVSLESGFGFWLDLERLARIDAGDGV